MYKNTHNKTTIRCYSSWQMIIIVSFNSKTTGVISGVGPALYPSREPGVVPDFNAVRVDQSFVFRVHSGLSIFFFSSLYLLSFDLKLLITSLASSNC